MMAPSMKRMVGRESNVEPIVLAVAGETALRST